MIKKYFYIILGLILVVGGVLRVTKLDTIPPHLGNDEISIAYDSYSVRMIGKDEHGYVWPLSFKSHQTYKAPLYAYLNIPINYILGNTEYGVRLLSVLFGIGAILVTALIADFMLGRNIALVAALIMAFNPKAIFASRIAFESNVAYVMMSFGILMMLYFLRKQKNIFLISSGLFFGLSIWGYHTQWGLTPALAVFLPWLTRKIISLKKWLLMWVVLIVLAFPIFFNFASVQRGDVNNRANSQLWFSSGQMKDYLNSSSDGIIKKIFVLVKTPVDNYLQHFSFDSLFTSGADLFNGESPLESGWFLIVTTPLLFIGLFNLKSLFGKYSPWLLAWWLLCPIIPSMTQGGVASVRNLSLLIPSALIMAGGFKVLINKNVMWSVIVSILFFINFFIFALAYYIHFPIDSGDNFQFGYKQAWEYIKPVSNSYSNIIVETKFGNYGKFVGVPHLYFGYFEAFTAQEMQKRIDFNGTRIGRYQFRDVDWNNEELNQNSIYIVSVINPIAGKASNKLTLINSIEKPNHDVQFLIYKTIDK